MKGEILYKINRITKSCKNDAQLTNWTRLLMCHNFSIDDKKVICPVVIDMINHMSYLKSLHAPKLIS